MYSVTHPPLWRAARYGVFATIEHTKLLELLDPATVIDVGAHTGQFALATSSACPRASLVSFEPQPDAATTYRKAVTRRAELIEVALGQSAGTARMHISRASDSSSLLNPSQAQIHHFPGTDVVGTLDVAVKTLDSALANRTFDAPILLKIDVQGTEIDVLRGAHTFLQLVDWVYVELSMVELYESQHLAPDVIAELRGMGFNLSGVYNLQTALNGLALQADFLFARSQRGDARQPLLS